MSIREDWAKTIYEFVHRGKTHLNWDELHFKYGRKCYYECADQIISLLKAEIEKMENPYGKDGKYGHSAYRGFEYFRKCILAKLGE